MANFLLPTRWKKTGGEEHQKQLGWAEIGHPNEPNISNHLSSKRRRSSNFGFKTLWRHVFPHTTSQLPTWRWPSLQGALYCTCDLRWPSALPVLPFFQALFGRGPRSSSRPLHDESFAVAWYGCLRRDVGRQVGRGGERLGVFHIARCLGHVGRLSTTVDNSPSTGFNKVQTKKIGLKWVLLGESQPYVSSEASRSWCLIPTLYNLIFQADKCQACRAIEFLPMSRLCGLRHVHVVLGELARWGHPDYFHGSDSCTSGSDCFSFQTRIGRLA